jgi:hypothetical protein
VDIQQRYLDRCEPAELHALLDELRSAGASAPRLTGWRDAAPDGQDGAWPATISDGPQAAQWLCSA